VKQLRGAKARRFYSALRKLNNELSTEFAQLAKLPTEQEFDVLSNIPFLIEFYVSRRSEIPLRRLLSDVKFKAKALQHPLGKMHDHLKLVRFKKNRRTFWDLDVVVSNVFPLSNSSQPSRVDLARLLKELSALIDAFNAPLLGTLRKKGRALRYPDLDVLVLNLEFSAQRAGGRFTFHRKGGVKKGTLIQALDWLRNRLLADPELRHLANFIPPPGRHPIATYEQAMRIARKSAAPSASPQ
jgi:hypothetical protein